MFSVGLFYTSLGVLLGLLGFRWLENQELGGGARYFESVRALVDKYAEMAKYFARVHLSLDSLTKYLAIVSRTLQYYTARGVAAVGHMLEHRARKVVHRTAKRTRTDHYLAEQNATPDTEVQDGESEPLKNK